MFTLIKGTKKTPRFTTEQLATKHYDMAMTGLKTYRKTHSKWELRKTAYNLTKYSIYRYHSLKDSNNQLAFKALFAMEEMTKEILGHLTPHEFLQDFPISKTYDGKRYQCTDYFSSIEQLSVLDMNKPLNMQTDDLVNLLWGYQNKEIMHLLTSIFSTVDKLRQFDGKPDMLTSFCQEKGINAPETMRVYKDHNGKKYAVDSNGKSMPLRKARPKYLRVIQ